MIDTNVPNADDIRSAILQRQPGRVEQSHLRSDVAKVGLGDSRIELKPEGGLALANRTIGEMKTHLLAKADASEDFRAGLIADPRSVISAEFGLSVPEGFNVQVHEDSATTAHLVLPMSDRLTEAELAQVAGAGWGQDSMDQLEDEMNNL